MDEIIHLPDIGRVNWLVRRWNKFVLVVSVDFRASLIFGKGNSLFSLYLRSLDSEEILADIMQIIFSKRKKVSRVNNPVR